MLQALSNGTDNSSSDYLATTSALNIQAIVPVDTVHSMHVSGNRGSHFFETTAPYAILGDRGGIFYDAILPLGRHVVAAVPYQQPDCQGPAGPNCGAPSRLGCVLNSELPIVQCGRLGIYFDRWRGNIRVILHGES